MYSNKDNVNILTALLVAHGIKHAVVCPGSRNAPIVHNLNEYPDISCYPVTDERSAGFYALGMMQSLQEPVAVCVTSGTALLNLLPAVAEACYQHQPMVVISADRPQAWINQLDGQTLPQQGALGTFVGCSFSLPEPCSDEERWYCNRLVNEALCLAHQHQPVHINVPISEPLFTFDTEQLPVERKVNGFRPTMYADNTVVDSLYSALCMASRPMIVIGQTAVTPEDAATVTACLSQYAVVLYEPLSHPKGGVPFDEVIYRLDNAADYQPDFLLYCGDTIVSKRLKIFLRKGVDSVWEISQDGSIHDTFMGVQTVVTGDVWMLLRQLSDYLRQAVDKKCINPAGASFVRLWQTALQHQNEWRNAFEPPYSQMAAVRFLESRVHGEALHYANSFSIRQACIYARHYVYCNRGVNGIEGSLSTAAGYSVVADRRVVCVIGDLSFFYDQNALWNQSIGGNLRILLLNNGEGGIFKMLPGLEQSAAQPLVAGRHSTTAEGICRQNNIVYLSARDEATMQQGIDRLLTTDSLRPVLLEVFTDARQDAAVYSCYYEGGRP